MADHSNVIRALVVKTEDARAIGDMYAVLNCHFSQFRVQPGKKYHKAENLPETSVYCVKQNVKSPLKSTLGKKSYDHFKNGTF